jgi:hypothetical protein
MLVCGVDKELRWQSSEDEPKSLDPSESLQERICTIRSRVVFIMSKCGVQGNLRMSRHRFSDGKTLRDDLDHRLIESDKGSQP